MKQYVYLYSLLSIIVILLSSCQKNTTYSANFAFSMPIGVLDGEFQSWKRDFHQYNPSVITMNNNIFFIANGDKIMKFSSNGVLLSIIDSTLINYELGSITLMAVDSNENIVFANIIANNDTSYSSFVNNEERAFAQLFAYSMDGSVLHFGRLGQKNYDFFSIHSIDVLAENTISVFSSEKNEKVMYLFDNNGITKNKTHFSSSLYPEYPFINDVPNQMYGVINKVISSFNVDSLLVQVDYYTYEKDEGTEVITNIDFFDSLIYTLDLQTGEYTDYTVLSFSSIEFLELQFVDEKSRFIFFNYDENKDNSISKNIPNIFIFDKKGNIETVDTFVLPDIEFIFSKYNISRDGFMSALFLEEDKVSVYWWKTSLLQ